MHNVVALVGVRDTMKMEHLDDINSDLTVRDLGSLVSVDRKSKELIIEESTVRLPSSREYASQVYRVCSCELEGGAVVR